MVWQRGWFDTPGKLVSADRPVFFPHRTIHRGVPLCRGAILSPSAENAKINVTDEPYFGTPKLCAVIFPFPKLLKAHKVVLNSTRPPNKNTHPLTFPKGSGHHKITWIAFIWPLSTARSHFHFSDDWSLLEMLVGERLCSRVSDHQAPPLSHWQLLEGRGR